MVKTCKGEREAAKEEGRCEHCDAVTVQGHCGPCLACQREDVYRKVLEACGCLDKYAANPKNADPFHDATSILTNVLRLTCP